jgi:hypothetical protein
MMTALVAEGSWSDDDLDVLRAEIDRVRRERSVQGTLGAKPPEQERKQKS